MAASCTVTHSLTHHLLLKGMAVMLPDNLESEWYVRNDGMCGMVVYWEWHLWYGRSGMAGMESGGLGMLSI